MAGQNITGLVARADSGEQIAAVSLGTRQNLDGRTVRPAILGDKGDDRAIGRAHNRREGNQLCQKIFYHHGAPNVLVQDLRH